MEPEAETRKLKLTFHTSSHVTDITEKGTEYKMPYKAEHNIVMDE